MRWDQRCFSVELNQKLVVRARLHEGASDSAPLLSNFFFWAFCTSGEECRGRPALTPLPSPVLLDAKIECAICLRTFMISLLLPRWSVCPSCSTWICARHTGDVSWQRCPRCALQLSDYVGGSSDNTPYVNAMNFLSNDNLDDTNEKFARVIRGI